MGKQGKKLLGKWFVLAALLVLTPIILVYASQPSSETIRVSIGEHTVDVEIAQTDLERARGLMFRQSMPDDRGMLFVFEDSATRSFWMKNTFIPLSIAYLGTDKRIINIHDMTPNNSEKTYRSTAPAIYALEVNVGWFSKRGIGPGAKVEFTLPEAEAQ